MKNKGKYTNYLDKLIEKLSDNNFDTTEQAKKYLLLTKQ